MCPETGKLKKVWLVIMGFQQRLQLTGKKFSFRINDRRVFNQRIVTALADTRSRLARDRALGPLRASHKAITARYPGLAGRLRQIKEEAVASLEDLVARAVERLRANGCQVFVAPDATAARDYLCRVVPPGTVVKSKTNVGKEIGVAEALSERGITVIETDLGDRITQLAGSHATHPLAPAIHIPVETIRDLFARESGRELSTDLEELVAVARHSLRSYLVNASCGISGANAIAADTGAVVLTENEGNIRAVTSLPEIHVVVAGINKIVPTFEDAVMVARAAAIFGAGQDIGTYISVITGPASSVEEPEGVFFSGQGPREVHVILLDNGRSRAVRGGYGEAFYCLNCGSCHNFCPVYGVLGDSFGQKYVGGIGLVQTVFTQGAEDALAGGLAACLTCGNCVRACPVQINTPSLILRLRQELAEKRGLAWPKRLAGYFFKDQERLSRTVRTVVRLAGPLLEPCALPRGVRLRLAAGAGQKRFLPESAPVPFLREAAEMTVPGKRPAKRVVLYVGCLVNVFYPRVAQAALDVFERLGVAVMIPKDQQCCGQPLWAAGDLASARRLARHNVECLNLEGIDAVVNLCASCGEMLLSVYPLLLADDPGFGEKARLLAARVRDITVFLADDLCWEGLPAGDGTEGLPVTYHDPCHLRLGQGVTDQPRRLLAHLPGVLYREMEDADACCGFGGLVSLEHYPLTAAIGRSKAEKIKASGASAVVTACPGCMLHLSDGLVGIGAKVAVKHIVELIAGALETVPSEEKPGEKAGSAR